MDYPDPELLLTSWLRSNLSPANVGRNLDDLEDRLPLVVVNHIGGADDLPTFADLTIDIGYYGTSADLESLSALARKGHHLVRFDLRGSVITVGTQSATVTDVHTGFLPFPDDTYGNPAIARYLSSYAITFKPRKAA